MEEKESKWEPTCDRFVAFLDIMGFRNMVFNKSHEDVVEIMERFRLPIKNLKKEAKERLEGRPQGWDTFKNTTVRPVIFSDSVLLISSDKSPGAARNIIWQTNLLITHALRNDIPIKGAIAYGEQTAILGKSLYIGKPLIDAYDLQKELLLYGVVLHHTMEKYLKESNGLKMFKDLNIFKYTVPMKSGNINHYIVDWTRRLDKGEDARVLVSNIYNNVSGGPRIYVDNTLEFVREITEKKARLKKKEKT